MPSGVRPMCRAEAKRTAEAEEPVMITIVTAKGAETGRIIHTRESGAILFRTGGTWGFSRWIEAGQFVTEGR